MTNGQPLTGDEIVDEEAEEPQLHSALANALARDNAIHLAGIFKLEDLLESSRPIGSELEHVAIGEARLAHPQCRVQDYQYGNGNNRWENGRIGVQRDENRTE